LKTARAVAGKCKSFSGSFDRLDESGGIERCFHLQFQFFAFDLRKTSEQQQDDRLSPCRTERASACHRKPLSGWSCLERGGLQTGGSCMLKTQVRPSAD
jgi:hypothetical protein